MFKINKQEELLKWREQKVEDIKIFMNAYLRHGWEWCLEGVKYHRGVLVEINNKLKQYGNN